MEKIERIKILDRKFKTMIPAEEIDKAVQRVADQLNERYKGKTPIFLGVLSGAFLFLSNSFQTRCCVIWDEDGCCAFVDPGCSCKEEFDKIISLVEKKGLKPVCIMLTHGHFDHILGVADLSARYGGLPVYMHPEDRFTLENNEYFSRCFGAPLPKAFDTTDVTEGSIVEVGALRFEVLETPGHTVGGVCYLERAEISLYLE